MGYEVLIGWMSIKDLARKLMVSTNAIHHLVRNKLLPQPIKLRIGYREFHWHVDDLEIFLFKQAKHSLNAKNH